ncbi:MAG: CpsD/CapB family tyrosine-protein kinase [Planctomycetota bacterium]
MGYIFDALQQQRQNNKGKAKTPAPDQAAPTTTGGELTPDVYTTAIPPVPEAAEPTSLTIPTAEGSAADAAPITLEQPDQPDESTIFAPSEAVDPQTEADTPTLTLTEPLSTTNHLHDEAWVESLDDRLVTLTDPASPTAEEYRSIRTSMLARHQRARHLVHLITSATPQEGKTLTTVNLGLALAELHNRRTLIIEADLRLPNFDALLNLPPESPGLLGILRGEETPENAIQAVGRNQLHILPAGGRTTNEAVTLLASNRMGQLVQQLSQEYDHVLIDTPPVVELADAGILSSLCHEVMLIARMRRTPARLIEQAIKTLKSYHAPVAGLIATDNMAHIGSGYSRYGYGYRYGYRYAYAKPKGRKSRSKKAAAATAKAA